MSAATAGAHPARIILIALGIALAMQFHLIFVQGVNWDEFLFLAKVYQFHDGTLTRALQSFHVRPLAWLTAIPGQEIVQLQWARIVMFACELMTIASIYGIARRYVTASAALLAGLAYLGAGYVFQHGAAFRADPIAASLLMTSGWILVAARLRPAAMLTIALLIAIAGLVTIKSVFYAPVLIGLAWWRWQEEDRSIAAMTRLTMAGALALPIFALLYLWHDAGLASADLASSQGMVENAYSTTIMPALFPQAGFMHLFVLRAPVATLLIAAALVCAFTPRWRTLPLITAIGLALPLTTFLFYGNALPYFYAFILPPVFVLVARALEIAIKRYGVLFPTLMIFANAAYLYAAMPKDRQARQQFLIAHIHKMYPQPVPYIDSCSMVPSFPKASFFMSDWGTNQYLREGKPVFAPLIAKVKPRFVIANHMALSAALRGEQAPMELLTEDRAALHSHFVHYWGPIWVARDEMRKLPTPPEEIPSEGPLFFDYPDDLFFDQAK